MKDVDVVQTVLGIIFLRLDVPCKVKITGQITQWQMHLAMVGESEFPDIKQDGIAALARVSV